MRKRTVQRTLGCLGCVWAKAQVVLCVGGSVGHVVVAKVVLKAEISWLAMQPVREEVAVLCESAT